MFVFNPYKRKRLIDFFEEKEYNLPNQKLKKGCLGMNKKRLLSLVLSFALVFTTVFAGAGSVFAGGKAVAKDKICSDVLKIEKSSLRGKLAAVEEDEPLNVKTMLYSNYSSPEYFGWDIGANGYALTSVTPKNTGMMYLDIRAEGEGLYDNAEVMLIESCEMTDQGLSYRYYTNYVWSISAGDKLTTSTPIPVSKGKKYQFLILTDENNSAALGVEARAKVYTTGSRTISAASSSKYALVSGMNQSGEEATTWFKVKAAKSGVMTVTLKSYGCSSSYGKVKLYSSEKNARSETVTYSSNGSKVKFGVKKGRTYYLKVTDCSVAESKNYKYGIRYTISSATDRNIGSKSKAKRIYRKADSATKSLFVAANANSVDYYKFTVKTARKTKITVKTNNITSGYVIMRLYNSKGKLMKKLEIPAQREGYIYTNSNLSKGTYYVKITKSLKASGAYTIRWTY